MIILRPTNREQQATASVVVDNSLVSLGLPPSLLVRHVHGNSPEHDDDETDNETDDEGPTSAPATDIAACR
jgi:hypothetical protein